MTIADQRASGCSGKERFDSHTLAMSVLHRRRKHKGSAPGGAYRCEFCAGWHLGGPKSRLRTRNKGDGIDRH